MFFDALKPLYSGHLRAFYVLCPVYTDILHQWIGHLCPTKFWADATSVHFAVQAVVFEGDGFVLLFGQIRAIKNRPVFYIAFFKSGCAIIFHGKKKFPGFMRLIYFNPGRRRVHIYLNLPT